MLGLRSQWFNWKGFRKSSLALLIGAGITVLYFWQLGDSTPGLSRSEASARSITLKLHSITLNPINAPLRVFQYLLQDLGHHGAFWMRLPSVVLALILIGFFYLLVKVWFGKVVGSLAAIMLATTPWIMLLARNAGPGITLLSPIAVLYGWNWLTRSTTSKHRNLAWLILIIISSLALYVPGIIWLVIVGGVLRYKEFLLKAREVPRKFLYGGLALGLILLLPLILGIIGNSEVAKSLVLWPHSWPSVLAIAKSAVWSVLALFLRAPHSMDIIIGRLPLLDATQIVLGIFGVYAMWSHARSQLFRLKALIILGVLAVGINQNLTFITLALPAVSIIVAAGLRYLYVEWRSIFPLNPIPRTLAVVIMIALVSLHCLLGVRYVLVAWPHTVATKQSYVIK